MDSTSTNINLYRSVQLIVAVPKQNTHTHTKSQTAVSLFCTMAISDDELQIKSLLVRERYYRDTSQWRKLRAAYHPESTKTHINITW